MPHPAVSSPAGALPADGPAPPLLTFIVPVRHPANAHDWSRLQDNLAQTAASIANQSHAGWDAVVVANEGAELPPLPPGFRVERVDFPPNLLHNLKPGQKKSQAFYDAFRMDKGRRVLAGMLTARTSRFFMIVDDDDFVSSRLVRHVAAHPAGHGWHINRGYVWDAGGRILMATEEFGRLCGTSLIVRSDLYNLPDTAEDPPLELIRDMLGSHRRIAQILADRGTPLAELPFRGAVYRVASPESHSRTPGIFVKYAINRKSLKEDPVKLLKTVIKLRLIHWGSRREFRLP